MTPIAHSLPYRATRRFQPIVLDYLDRNAQLADHYCFVPDLNGLSEAISARKISVADRVALVSVLNEQYRHFPKEESVERNIALLASETTFTICTAHQPNLATGYLYFVYKILHAIKLAQALNAQYPQRHFVPVYYMGSEDADLDELGTFRYGDKKFVWDGGRQKGAVGRMNTAGLRPLLDELFSILGPPGEHREELVRLLQNAYLGHQTIAQATRSLVHALFGRYGLIVLDADDTTLKRQFIPVMEEDLLSQSSESLVRRSIAALEEAGYKGQAHPRAINLFYLNGDVRERIEQSGDDCWQVVNTPVSWSKKALLQELHAHPERFSPNVILRPLYQETILPNIAFIGGGAEVAYWLQLKELFGHHGVFYPAILLRQSVMWMNASASRLYKRTGLELEQIFLSPDEAARTYVVKHSSESGNVASEREDLRSVFESLKQKATSIDKTLERSAGAALQKIQHQIDKLEEKMLRAQKRQMSTGLELLQRLQSMLFPGGGLGERVENFMPYYLGHGPRFFDALLTAIEPLSAKFLVLEESAAQEL